MVLLKVDPPAKILAGTLELFIYFHCLKLIVMVYIAQIDDDLTARISMADVKFSFHEKSKFFDPAWMSPETLQKKQEDMNIKAGDMWSFAILLWEMATRQIPFADLSSMEIGMKVNVLIVGLNSIVR